MPPTPKPYVSSSFESALMQERGITGVQGIASSSLPEPTPDELCSIYSQGFRGAAPDLVLPSDMPMVEAAAKARITLYEAFPWLQPGTGRGKKLMPYAGALSLDPTWGGDEAQTRGSCVSHSTRNAATVDYGLDAFTGQTQWKGRLCTENNYRHRGYDRDGWYCGASASKIEANGAGGLLFRQKYVNPDNPRDVVDLSKFSSATERWAGNGSAGVPEWLRKIEQENQAAFCIPVTTIDEYLDALYLGFGISVCSGFGFSKNCDEYGYAQQSGSWSHAMMHGGADNSPWAQQRYSRVGGGVGMVMQSWGPWNNQRGDRMPPDFEIVPIGCFFAGFSTIKKMIASDAYAICSVEGWDRAISINDFVKSSTFQDKIQQRLSERVKHANDIK